MPRTKKQQKIQRRSWDDDEEVCCYDVVMKNPVFYKQPIHTHGKVILYGDVIIDVNSFIQNQQYIPKLQIGLTRINKLVKLIKEQQIIIYTESLYPQITDFSSIINLLKSLSCKESYELALTLEKHQQKANRQLKLCSEQQTTQIALHYDPEVLLQKCQTLVKQNLDYDDQIYAFNLYTFDPEKKRLNRYLACNDIKLMLLLCDDEEELKRRFLSYKINQPQGDMNQFVKIQIPSLDEQIEEEIKIYTFDNYIIHAKITQLCIKLSENSNNTLMLRKYHIDPRILEELKRVRQQRRILKQQIINQVLLDQSQSSSSHLPQSCESISQYDDTFSSVETFLPKFDPVSNE